MRDYPIGFFSQDGKHFYSFFFSKKTPSISYKILQMRVLYTNPCRDAIIPSYVDPHWLIDNIHSTPITAKLNLYWNWSAQELFGLYGNIGCWIKASHCLSTPSEPPLRPSCWLFRVATTSRHISCINVTGCMVWLEKTRLHRCFRRIQSVIGLTNSSTTWDLTLIGVAWILSMVEKNPLVLLSPKSSPPLDVRTCQLGPAMITNIHSPTWWCLAPYNAYISILLTW